MINKINFGYRMDVLETIIRDEQTSLEDLRMALFQLGEAMGDEILGIKNTTIKNIKTPMKLWFRGKKLKQTNPELTIVISTKDDYQYFARGISSNFKLIYQGWMDFNGVRGALAYSNSFRSVEFPQIPTGSKVKRVIIAKSVIASGCTAITLAKKARDEYYPEELIIVAPFYSQKGIDELNAELNPTDIFVAFGPDELDDQGLLIPGVGNLDKRLIG